MIFFVAAVVLTVASFAISRKLSLEFVLRTIFYFFIFLIAYFANNVFSKAKIETYPPILLIEGNKSSVFWENRNIFRDRFGSNIYFLADDTFFEVKDSLKDLKGELTDRALYELYLSKGVQKGEIFCLCEKVSLGGFVHDAFLKADQVVFLVQNKKKTSVSIVDGPSIVFPPDTALFSLNLVNEGLACLETLWVSLDGRIVDSFQIEMKTSEHKNFEYRISELENGNHRLSLSTPSGEDYFDFSVGAEILPVLIYSDRPDWEVSAIRRLLSEKKKLRLSVFVEGMGDESFYFDGSEEHAVGEDFNPESYSLVFWISEENPFASGYRWRDDCVLLWVLKTSEELEESRPDEIFLTDIGLEHELTKNLNCERVTVENFLKPLYGTTFLLSSRSGPVLATGSIQGKTLLTVAHGCFSNWYFSGGESRGFAEKILENTVSWAIEKRGKTIRISLPKRFFSTEEAVSFWVCSREKPVVSIDGEEILCSATEQGKFFFFLPEIKAGSHIVTVADKELSDTAFFKVEEWMTPESFCAKAENARVWDLDSFLNFGQNIEKTIIKENDKSFIHDMFPAALFLCAVAVFVWFLEERRI